MATTEQLTELFRQNAVFLEGLQRQQNEALKALVDGMKTNQNSGVKTGLDDRKYRDMGTFTGQENSWNEFALKFKATTKEANPQIFEAMKWAELQEDEINESSLDLKFDEGKGTEMATSLYNRLIKFLSGPALTVHQSVPDENGLEVWRRLSKRYNPMTPMRGLQIMLKAMMPPKITKGQDVHTQINKWEGLLNILERDYREQISDMTKIGLLIHMMPDDLQDTILQHADHLQGYKAVKEKAVGLVDARQRLRDPNAMDIGYAGYPAYGNCNHYDDYGEDEEQRYEEVGAVGEDRQCYRCGGYGHLAAECGTPKGNGKGKGGKGGKGAKGGFKGKGKHKGDHKGDHYKGDGKGKGKQQCSHCGKPGHGPANCWALHPEQMTWKYANGVDEETEDYTSGFDVGSLEVEEPKRRQQRPVVAPPGLVVRNRFELLTRDPEAEYERAIGGLEVEVPDAGINMVKKSTKLVKAGFGHITVDSGAAESVMPMGMLENEELVEGAAKMAGVKYVAANGARMANFGEKSVKFKCSEGAAMNKIMFQVTEVGKPLASVSKILDKGNVVVFSRGKKGSYILNEKTGSKIALKEDKGTFVMDVEFYQPEGETKGRVPGFTRQGM